MKAFLAIQCVGQRCDALKTGTFLYQTKNVDGVFIAVSPIFPGMIELLAWCRVNGWKSGASDPAYPVGVYEKADERLTQTEAYAQLPVGAKWFSSFGNPGEGGFTEYWRTPDGRRLVISNGPWYGPEIWKCEEVR